MAIEYRLALDPRRPFVAVSSGKSTVFRTGAQRSEYPVFTSKTAPCRLSCPIGIDIPGAFGLASTGDWDGALSVFLQENPLPGVCGRVCYHPCEFECNRGKMDEPISIRGLERFLSDRGKASVPEGLPLQSKKKEVAVVGAGPAGLSASYHLARLGYKVSLFEARPKLGGMLRYGIPRYRLPHSVLDRDIERILSLGVKVHARKKAGQNLSWRELESYDAIFVSLGLQSSKALRGFDVAEKAIVSGLDFLSNPRKWAFGKTSEKTIILGGGNVAMDVARTLLRLRRGDGKHILLISPESRETMPALHEEVQEALEEGLTIVNELAPLKVRKNRGKFLSLDFMKAKVGKDRATGAIRICRVGKEIRTYHASTVIAAIGQALESLPMPRGIERRDGRLAVDLFGRTPLPKFFVGGDASGGKAFVADAIAGGKMGALSIACFLEGSEVEKELCRLRIGAGQSFSFHHLLNPPLHPVDLSKIVSFEQINSLFFRDAPREEPEQVPAEKRRKTFQEVSRGMAPSTVDKEISRCFKCGTCIDCGYCMDFCPDVSISRGSRPGSYSFDEAFCKGCGICSVACPRSVIAMVRETK